VQVVQPARGADGDLHARRPVQGAHGGAQRAVQPRVDAAVGDELVAQELHEGLARAEVAEELHQVAVVQPAQHLHLHQKLAVALVPARGELLDRHLRAVAQHASVHLPEPALADERRRREPVRRLAQLLVRELPRLLRPRKRFAVRRHPSRRLPHQLIRRQRAHCQPNHNHNTHEEKNSHQCFTQRQTLNPKSAEKRKNSADMYLCCCWCLPRLCFVSSDAHSSRCRAPGAGTRRPLRRRRRCHHRAQPSKSLSTPQAQQLGSEAQLDSEAQLESAAQLRQDQVLQLQYRSIRSITRQETTSM
jgi:hypothetical protein